jgi:hypothetical protein
LGHHNASTRLDIYVHFVPETDRWAADLLSTVLERAKAEGPTRKQRRQDVTINHERSDGGWELSPVPRDLNDLYLAPVALALDSRIAELGAMSYDELRMAVGSASDEPDWTREIRIEGLLRTVTYLTDTHGWSVDWDVRGVRLSHDKYAIVLGIPPVFREFVAGP